MFSSLLHHAQHSSSLLEDGSKGSYASSSGAGDDIPMTILTDIITASDTISSTVAAVAANIEMEDLSHKVDEELVKETATNVYNAVLKLLCL